MAKTDGTTNCKYLMKEVAIPKALRDCYEANQQAGPNSLSNLSTFNILIGPNNSGKSLLLRHMFHDDLLDYSPNDEKINELCKEVNEAKATWSKIGNKDTRANKLVDVIHTPFVLEGANNLSEFSEQLISPLDDVRRYWTHELNAHGNQEIQNKIIAPIRTLDHILHNTGIYEDLLKQQRRMHHVYIPTMCGLRPLKIPS